MHWSELPLLHAAMKPELIAGGAHIVPYGIDRVSSLLNSFFRPRQGWQRFLEQHPDYHLVERPSERVEEPVLAQILLTLSPRLAALAWRLRTNQSEPSFLIRWSGGK